MAAALDTCTKQEQHATWPAIWCPQLLEHTQCFVHLQTWMGVPTRPHQQCSFGCLLNILIRSFRCHNGKHALPIWGSHSSADFCGFHSYSTLLISEINLYGAAIFRQCLLGTNGLELNQTQSMPPSNFEMQYPNCMDAALILPCVQGWGCFWIIWHKLKMWAWYRNIIFSKHVIWACVSNTDKTHLHVDSNNRGMQMAIRKETLNKISYTHMTFCDHSLLLVFCGNDFKLNCIFTRCLKLLCQNSHVHSILAIM
jgi:hypothetical protein